MFAQSLFLGLALAAPPPSDAPLGPRLDKGLELRWAGTFTEASFRPGVRTLKNYEVETRLLVFESGDFGADGVLCTRVSLKPDRKPAEPTTPVVRLDLVRVDPHGKVQILPSPADVDNPTPKARPFPAVQLQALPMSESGLFVEFPDKPAKPGLVWSREDGGRPIVSWKIADTISLRGQLGLKVVAEQKTANYYAERVRQAEWRRQETLTVMPNNGFASKFVRVIERREPEADELAFRSVLTLELTGRMSLSGRLLQERRDEAVQAAAFTAALDRLLADGGRGGPKHFETLASRIDAYVRENGSGESLPFRESLALVKKRSLAAAKGELPPAPTSDDGPAISTNPLTIGRLIPDVTAQSLTAPGSTKLSKLQGKPVVLVYFQPAAGSAMDVLKLAEQLHKAKFAEVVPLAIGEAADAKRLHSVMKLTVPVYDGLGTYKVHALDATPVLIVIDAAGVIRYVARGWTDGTAEAVTKELERAK